MHIRCLALIWIALVSWGHADETILNEYFGSYDREVEKVSAVLSKQATVIAADLIRNGKSAEAASLEEQVKRKIAGAAVETPVPAASTLFQQYDTARSAAIKPLQAKAITRIDSLIRTAEARAEMKQVVELGKAKALVESGKPREATKTAFPYPEQLKSLTRRPWTWSTVSGTSRIEFREDGTFEHTVFKGAFVFQDEKTVLLTWGAKKQVLTFDFAKGELKGFAESLNQEIRGERTR
jgi:hypothetical protein